MSRAAAFLEAIREDFDDDVPRLIFADWLTDQGDPRGEFIHTQVRLAALSEGDPARLDLMERAADLFQENQARWVGPALRLARAWEFHRGFVRHVTIDGQGFAEVGAELLESFPLQGIRLVASSVAALEYLAACPYVDGIRSLEWCSVSSSHAPPALVSQSLSFLGSPTFGRLTALGLTGNAVGHPELQTLLASPVMPRLGRLDLTGNTSLGNQAGRQLASSPATTGLEDLILSRTGVGAHGLIALLNQASFRHMRRLEVAQAMTSETPDGAIGKALAASPILPRLTALRLDQEQRRYPIRNLAELLMSSQVGSLRVLGIGHQELGDGGVRALAGSAHLGQLNVLDLSDNGLTHGAAQVLADSPHLAHLTDLNLAGNAIRDRGLKALAASPGLARLSGLNVSGNILGGPGLHALVDSPNLTRLTSLGLGKNFIGREAVALLTSSPSLAHLTRLDLSRHDLDADAVAVLAASPHLARLEYLDLRSNKLGDAGLRNLAGSPRFTRLIDLELGSNEIGHEGCDGLMALFANSPVLKGLRRLGLKDNVFSDVEKERLRRSPFGRRLDLG